VEGMGVEGIDIVSLAKREEEVFLPKQSKSILLPRDSSALYLIQRIRDEAHRFAITYHRNLRSKALKKSTDK
ncbi:MAG: excinuclease ABC subunit C, partial [bacterium]|nr:excinuclease ABC subunit C [bacterium]